MAQKFYRGNFDYLYKLHRQIFPINILRLECNNLNASAYNLLLKCLRIKKDQCQTNICLTLQATVFILCLSITACNSEVVEVLNAEDSGASQPERFT